MVSSRSLNGPLVKYVDERLVVGDFTQIKKFSFRHGWREGRAPDIH